MDLDIQMGFDHLVRNLKIQEENCEKWRHERALMRSKNMKLFWTSLR